MILSALDGGVPARWVAGDEVYRGNPALRGDLEQRGVGYVLAVACDHHGSTAADDVLSSHRGRGAAIDDRAVDDGVRDRRVGQFVGNGLQRVEGEGCEVGMCADRHPAGPAGWSRRRASGAGRRARSSPRREGPLSVWSARVKWVAKLT
jgi:hypothetical protein